MSNTLTLKHDFWSTATLNSLSIKFNPNFKLPLREKNRAQCLTYHYYHQKSQPNRRFEGQKNLSLIHRTLLQTTKSIPISNFNGGKWWRCPGKISKQPQPNINDDKQISIEQDLQKIHKTTIEATPNSLPIPNPTQFQTSIEEKSTTGHTMSSLSLLSPKMATESTISTTRNPFLIRKAPEFGSNYEIDPHLHLRWRETEDAEEKSQERYQQQRTNISQARSSKGAQNNIN